MTSYYNSGSSAGTPLAVHDAVATGLLACGWTLSFTSGTFTGGGTHYRVYQSPDTLGETGIFYYLVFLLTGGTMTLSSCQDFDSGAVAVIGSSASSSGINYSGATGTFYVFANPQGAFYFCYDVAYLFKVCFWVGQPQSLQIPGVTDGLCLTTAGISAAATSVAVDRDVSARLRVGQVVAIYNFAHSNASANKSHKELLTITSLSAGSIGFNACTNAYDTGAKIGAPDLLWSVGGGGTGATWQNFNGDFAQISSQAFGIDTNTANSPTVTSCIGNISGSGVNANLDRSNSLGMPAFCITPYLTQAAASDGSSGQPCPGWIFAYINFSGGNPADGTKFTDGTNVYILPRGGTGAGSGKPSWLMRTTDAVNFATQTLIPPPIIQDHDGPYSIPSATGAAPSNTLNQGLN